MITSSFTLDAEPAYSRTVIPMHAIEQGTTDAYIDALLAMHLTFLGLR